MFAATNALRVCKSARKTHKLFRVQLRMYVLYILVFYEKKRGREETYEKCRNAFVHLLIRAYL